MHPSIMDCPSPLSLDVPMQSSKSDLAQPSYGAFSRDHRRELKAKPPKRHLQDDSNSKTLWDTQDVGYFDGETKRFCHIEEAGFVLHFHHVVAFVNRLRALSVFRTEDTIRYNIHSCLRGKALEWFISELSQQDRECLRTLPLEEGWFKALETRFRPCTLASEMLEVGWDGEDWISAQCSEVLLAHSMLRHLQVTQPEAHPVQWLRELWLKAPMNLQDKLPEPTQMTSVLEFMSNLDLAGTEEDHECGMFVEDEGESD